jgi:TPR repeat protein
MLSNGEGVKQDKGEAVKWYLKAAQQNDVSAQYNLALAFDEGDGVAADLLSAYFWYRLAADQGDEDARNNAKALRLRMNALQVNGAERRLADWKRGGKPL